MLKLDGRAPRRIGVRALLFLVLSMTSALPVAVLGLNQAALFAKKQIEITDRQAEAAAHASADELSLSMSNAVHAAESFSEVVARGDHSPQQLRSAITAHTSHHPDQLGGYVADAHGTSLINMTAGGEILTGGINYADRDYFREIMHTHRPAVSRAQVGRSTHVLSISVAAPIHDENGEITGITCISIDLRSVAARAKRAVGGLSEGRLAVVDAEGRLLADSDHGARLEARDVSKLPLFMSTPPGVAQLRVGLDDRDRPVRSVAVGLGEPITGWRVVAMSPQSVIDVQTRHVRYRVVAVALGLILVTLLLAAWLAVRLARPLQGVAATALAVSRGEFPAPPPVSGSAPREMAQLVDAIGQMIARLGAYTSELESKVKARTLDLSRANEELSTALSVISSNEQLMREDIEQGRLFQEKMLPPRLARRDLDVATHYLPLERVSGDIFDVCELGSDRVRFFLADVTGHGVQASMRTIWLKTTYDRIKLSAATPGELLSRLNRALLAEFPEGGLVCAASCIDVRLTGSWADVQYANAANEPLYVLSQEGPAREIYASGPLLGARDTEWQPALSFELQEGELLLIASDGLAEQMNARHERFEDQMLGFCAGVNAEATLQALLAGFSAFRDGAPIADDITLITVARGRRPTASPAA